jgi:hypothetical protein
MGLVNDFAAEYFFQLIVHANPSLFKKACIRS